MKNKGIRIGSLYLKNYAPFFESMGIKEFTFDRSKSPNNLVLILGANGSGKTYLMSELTPEPMEHIGQRTSRRFLKDEEGKKIISFIVSDANNIDTDIYVCSITYTADGRKTVCSFVHKNLTTGEEKELNENGNVSSYMELCKTHLGYDKTYKNIGYISDDIKNIISMSYNERNNLMSNWIPSTTEFSIASKIAMKKRNQAEKEIEGLMKDIVKITVGDSNKNIDTETEKLKIKEAKLNKVKDGLSKAELVQTSLNRYTKDLVNQHKKEYLEAVKRHNEFYNKNSNDLIEYSKYLGPDGNDKLKLKLNELEISRNSLMISERMLNDDILRLTNDIESSSLPNNDNSIKGYDIISVTSSLKDIEKDISDISNFKIQTLKSNPEYNDFTVFKPEIKDASTSTITSLTNIAMISTKIEHVCGNYNFKSIFDNSSVCNVGEELENIKRIIFSLQEQEKNLNETLHELESQSVDYGSFKEFVPSKCNEKTCSLIAELLNRARDSSSSRINDTRKQLDEVRNKIEENRKLSEQKQILIQNLKNSLFDMRQVSDTLKSLDGKTYYLPKSLREEIDSPIPYNVLEKVSSLLEDAKRFDEYVSLLEKENALNESKKNLSNISKIITMSDEAKAKLENKIVQRSESIKQLETVTNKLKEINEEKEKLNKLSESVKILRENKESIIKSAEQLEIKKKTILKEGEYLYNNRILINCISGLKDLEFSLNKDISTIKADIEKMKAAITSLDTLKARKATLEIKRDLYDVLFKVWNTKDGYPSILIKDFLDEVADAANRDLDKSWGGVLNIDEFSLENGEFKIPVIRGNTVLNDASETSKAEKATLGLSISTGIIDVSTENSLYNIVRLDECDGGFDGPRRQSFLENITTRLNEINCKNVFCITHNNCFENISCDVILLKGWDSMTSESSLLNKNIIFKYDKMI